MATPNQTVSRAEILIRPHEFNKANFVVLPPNEEQVQPKNENDKPIKNYRMPVGYRDTDGVLKTLVIAGPRGRSFKGVGANYSKESGDVTGYSVGINLNSNSDKSLPPTPEEQKLISVLEYFYELMKEKMVEYKREINKRDLRADTITGMCAKFIYRQLDDDGNIVPNGFISMYAKLVARAKKLPKGQAAEYTILTPFYDLITQEKLTQEQLENGGSLDITPAYRVESFFCGSKISVQMKLREAYVTVLGGGFTRILPRPEVEDIVNPMDIGNVADRINQLGITSDEKGKEKEKKKKKHHRHHHSSDSE